MIVEAMQQAGSRVAQHCQLMNFNNAQESLMSLRALGSAVHIGNAACAQLPCPGYSGEGLELDD